MSHYLKIDKMEVLDIIFDALRKNTGADPRVNDVTRDGDHKSAEIILTTDDGQKKQNWVISSKKIVETDVIE